VSFFSLFAAKKWEILFSLTKRFVTFSVIFFCKKQLGPPLRVAYGSCLNCMCSVDVGRYTVHKRIQNEIVAQQKISNNNKPKATELIQFSSVLAKELKKSIKKHNLFTPAKGHSR
jgi:hypothetical protein